MSSAQAPFRASCHPAPAPATTAPAIAGQPVAIVARFAPTAAMRLAPYPHARGYAKDRNRRHSRWDCHWQAAPDDGLIHSIPRPSFCMHTAFPWTRRHAVRRDHHHVVPARFFARLMRTAHRADELPFGQPGHDLLLLRETVRPWLRPHWPMVLWWVVPKFPYPMLCRHRRSTPRPGPATTS